jgi:TRAP-type C4-dicarboxylate transport system permease small subunit
VYDFLKRGDRRIAGIERILVLGVVLVILVTQVADVALREFGRGGLNGASELARWLVLALAFQGASLATAERRHITIDLLDRSITPRVKAVFNIIVQGLGVLVVLYLAWGAWELVLDKRLQHLGVGLDLPGWLPRAFLESDFLALPRAPDGSLPEVPKMPQWIFLLVAPCSLFLIGWRFFLLCLEDLGGLKTGVFDYLVPKTEEGRLY